MRQNETGRMRNEAGMKQNETRRKQNETGMKQKNENFNGMKQK